MLPRKPRVTLSGRIFVGNYFKERGITNWQLVDVANRPIPSCETQCKITMKPVKNSGDMEVEQIHPSK
jgi:hypothetical protein